MTLWEADPRPERSAEVSSSSNTVFVKVWNNFNSYFQFSGKHLYKSCLKHCFIIPTDAHNYKITGMLETIKIPIIAPTCFGPRRNHHQGAISCLAKTIIMILLCLSLMTSMSWQHTSLCASVRYTVEEGTSFLYCVPCLAKITIIILLCSLLMTWSMSWRHTSLCASVQYTVEEGTSFLCCVPHACT